MMRPEKRTFQVVWGTEMHTREAVRQYAQSRHSPESILDERARLCRKKYCTGKWVMSFTVEHNALLAADTKLSKRRDHS